MLAFSQALMLACHWPPAFSQSAFVLYWEKSVDAPPLVEGLAEGDVVDGALDEPEPEVPGLLELPLGLLLSELPGILREPPLVPWASSFMGSTLGEICWGNLVQLRSGFLQSLDIPVRQQYPDP